MSDLDLEIDEEIIRQAFEVGRYPSKKDEEYINIDEMYLTNKNIILMYEKSNGIFSKSEEIVEKIPLEKIRVANGKIQVFKRKNIEDELGLQIIYKNGSRDHFVFDNKKELPIWYDSIIAIINGEEIPKVDEITDDTDSLLGAGTIMSAAKNIITNVKNKAINQINTSSVQNRKVEKESDEKYCSNCGKIIKSNSKFCTYCGQAVNYIPSDSKNDYITEKPTKREYLEPKREVAQKEISRRENVYEGSIHKCPNCGEVLKTFEMKCPSCGIEIRTNQTSYSIKEFSEKLEQIESEREYKKSSSFGILNMYGALFNRGAKMLMGEDGISNTDKKKINLIKNYTIPNNKEDVFEFIILAATSIDISAMEENNLLKETENAISTAWLTKMEQAYQKALLFFSKEPEFENIKQIYDKTIKSIEKKKKTYKRSIFMSYFWSIGALVIMCIIIIAFFACMDILDNNRNAENQKENYVQNIDNN